MSRRTSNIMRHEYHPLDAIGLQEMAKVKDMGLAFYDYLTTLGEGRELSLAKTKIEEAVMWATKWVTR